MIEHCVRNQLIRLRSLGGEAFGVTLCQSENCDIGTVTVNE